MQLMMTYIVKTCTDPCSPNRFDEAASSATDDDLFLEYIIFKDSLIEYKCWCCNKNYQHKFEGKLKEQFLIHTNFLTTTIISWEKLGNI